jgi:predicted RNA-binding protein YlxR (DUF448 family)
MSHIPIRTCVACRTKRPASELLRVRKWQGTISADAPGGRGAWICPNEDCIVQAFQKRLLVRALRLESSPPDWEQCMARLLQEAYERHAKSGTKEDR